MTNQTDRPSQEPVAEEKKKERAEERALFARYKTDPSDVALEEQLVAKYTPLVYRIVHKFRPKADLFPDLVQVGQLGLVHAIRRFDIERGFAFSTFAWQTIEGEIRRYFRDRTWAINVPRDLKERSLKVFNAKEELSATVGQDPTVTDLANKTGFTEEQVQEAMELGSAYHPQSFTTEARDSDAGYGVAESASPQDGRDMTKTKRDIFWESLLEQLDEAEAIVLRMYYFEQKTQKDIADKLCTSQMNVSRLNRKALGKLRRLIIPEDIENLGML